MQLVDGWQDCGQGLQPGEEAKLGGTLRGRLGSRGSGAKG